MTVYANQVVPPFDFAEALSYDPDERMRRCVDRVRHHLSSQGLWDIFLGIPPVPSIGASEDELRELEDGLGVPLPPEYRAFLSNWRYLIIDKGLKVWGLDHEGVTVGRPWVSDMHRPDVRYLVFGDYWNYADGDQLMFDPSQANGAVVTYLHEHGRFTSHSRQPSRSRCGG